MRSSKVLTLFSRPITTSLITNTKNDKTNATPTSIKMGSPLSNSFQPPKKTNKYITIRQRRNIPAHLKSNLILSYISLPPCKFLVNAVRLFIRPALTVKRYFFTMSFKIISFGIFFIMNTINTFTF